MLDLPDLLMIGALLAAAQATPGPTIATLLARTVAQGHDGAAPFIVGLIVADLVWLSAAVFGLALLAATAQPVLLVLKYAGAAYLVYLAWRLWTAPVQVVEGGASARDSRLGLLGGGLSLGLGNAKTGAFYLALLPAVLPVAEVSVAGYLEISAVLVVVYAGVLTGYVALAARARRLLMTPRRLKAVNRLAGGVIAGTAVLVAARA
jgi:threonine/homoserine/homoserine lactone efflux protein